MTRLPDRIVSGSGEFTRQRPEDDEPLYQLEPGGAPAVATGRVFIRFSEQVDAASRADEIASAGYRIGQTVPYAPNAAWLEPQSGNIADALSHLGDLQSLADVENVEPQMIMERGKK